MFVHGATNPASTGFDLKFDGLSWMDYIAASGYDVYLLDLRGYGRSTRPREMDGDPKTNAPLVRGEEALRDISSVVDFVLRRRNIPRVNLIGHSWGTTLMASYATRNPDKVERLVLYAPQWLRTMSSPVMAQAGSGPLGAYRLVTVEQTRARRLTGVPQDKQAGLFPTGWFEAWADATWATDPKAAAHNPPAMRAPNGPLQDTREYWSAGRPQSAEITAKLSCDARPAHTLGHVWTAPGWQELSSRLQHWSVQPCVRPHMRALASSYFILTLLRFLHCGAVESIDQGGAPINAGLPCKPHIRRD